jgi:hypothetical protein
VGRGVGITRQPCARGRYRLADVSNIPCKIALLKWPLLPRKRHPCKEIDDRAHVSAISSAVLPLNLNYLNEAAL